MLRHPTDPSRKLVRRVAAVEGEEMLSTDDQDEPFQLEKGQCWVLCDNPSISFKVSPCKQIRHQFGRCLVLYLLALRVWNSYCSGNIVFALSSSHLPSLSWPKRYPEELQSFLKGGNQGLILILIFDFLAWLFFKPQDAQDSRTFGPLAVSNIEGRVIYFKRSTIDHGPVLNR